MHDPCFCYHSAELARREHERVRSGLLEPRGGLEKTALKSDISDAGNLRLFASANWNVALEAPESALLVQGSG
jgi:hypothetical protein